MEDKKIKACTFACDEQFHFTRVSVYSFIEHNTWFDGEIILIDHHRFPLSDQNFNKLKLIYNNLIKVTIGSDVIFSPAIVKNQSIYLQQVKEYSKIYAFSLGRINLLYFSNSCLFMKNVTSILEPNKNVTTPEKSLFYIGLENSIFSDFLEYEKKDPTSFLEDNFNLKNFVKKESIMLSALQIRDNKFNQLRETVSRSAGIHYNDIILTNKINFQRIKHLWMDKNNEIERKLSSPLKKNFLAASAPKLVPKQPTAAKKASPSSIVSNKINQLELIGKTYLDKKLAICTVCNDQFLPGALCLIQSFLQSNKWFSGDIIINYSEKHSPLSENSRAALSKLSPLVKFNVINDREYTKVFNRFLLLWRGTSRERFLPSLFTYEVFELVENYDQALFLDSDMLVIGDISHIFNLNHPIVVTPDAGEYDLNRTYSSFNGGFLLISNSIQGKKTKSQLLQLSEKTSNHHYADQSILNDYFKKSARYLNSQYNCLKRCFPDELFSTFDKDIKIIHYVGAKPWQTTTQPFELKYSRIENLWKKNYVKIK